ncbi:hypothetical protein ACLOJK_027966 [Asimina triloba]
MNADLYLGMEVKRGGSHQADDGRAVGIRDESSLTRAKLDVRHCVRINLRNYKRNIRIHPEGGAVIYNDGTSRNSNRTKLSANRPTRAKQRNVDAIEAVLGKLFDDVFSVLEGEAIPGRSFAGQHADAAAREIAVGEHAEELLADSAGDADDC